MADEKVYMLNVLWFKKDGGAEKYAKYAAAAARFVQELGDSMLDGFAPDLALIGEVGLSGELRRVPRLEPRLREAIKLGFSSIVVPKGADPSWDLPSQPKLHEMAGLSEALEFALQD